MNEYVEILDKYFEGLDFNNFGLLVADKAADMLEGSIFDTGGPNSLYGKLLNLRADLYDKKNTEILKNASDKELAFLYDKWYDLANQRTHSIADIVAKKLLDRIEEEMESRKH